MAGSPPAPSTTTTDDLGFINLTDENNKEFDIDTATEQELQDALSRGQISKELLRSKLDSLYNQAKQVMDGHQISVIQNAIQSYG